MYTTSKSAGAECYSLLRQLHSDCWDLNSGEDEHVMKIVTAESESSPDTELVTQQTFLFSAPTFWLPALCTS